MAALRCDAPAGGLYERLLQRLALALDEADSLSVVFAQPLLELELRGLTPAEMQLIRAYLNHDLDWLRSGHAATQEMAQLEQLPSSQDVSRTGRKDRPMLPVKAKASLKGRLQLCCGLCGALAGWQVGRGVQACKICGSQLLRTSNYR